MPLQLDEVLREVLVQPPVGDVPQLDGAVFRRGGDDVVVEGVPLDIEDLPAVPGHLKKRERQYWLIILVFPIPSFMRLSHKIYLLKGSF